MQKSRKINNLKELADAVGVSTASVSLVLNNKWHKKVKKSIAEKILQLTAEHHFSLNPLGRGLTMKKFFRISLVIAHDMADYPLMGAFSLHDFITHITGSLNNAGYALDIIQVTDAMYEQITAGGKIAEQTDGYIFIGWEDERIRHLLEKLKFQHPYIVFDNDLTDSKYSYVYKNPATILQEVGAYFGEHGNKTVKIIHFGEDSKRLQQKLSGLKCGLKKYDITLKKRDIILLPGNESIKSGYEATRNLIEQNKLPDALFFSDNICAIGGLWALDKLGLKVPDDIELISYGDEAFAAQSPIPLTYIKITSRQTAEYCIGQMIEWVEGREEFHPVQQQFIEEFVVGQTTRE